MLSPDIAYGIGGTIAGAMGAMGSPLGTVMGGLTDYLSSAYQQQKANSYNQAMYEDAKNFLREREDLAWDRSMEASNTQIQRLMADAKAAGINPLAVIGQLGSSPQASATSGASAKSFQKLDTSFSSVAKAAFKEFSSIVDSAFSLLKS